MTPIYVINLARSADRRAWMTDELGRAGVSANFVAAVDGRAFKDKCRARVAATPLTVGEIALTLSHRKIWRALLASAQTPAIVLEDDVRLGDGFAELPALDWSRWNFDFVKIETMFDPVWATRRGEAVGSRTLHRLGGEHHGSAAYLVSRKLAFGGEFRTKPNNLGVAKEEASFDLFAAYFLNKNLSLTAAYVDLGNIVLHDHQDGVYLSLQAGL